MEVDPPAGTAAAVSLSLVVAASLDWLEAVPVGDALSDDDPSLADPDSLEALALALSVPVAEEAEGSSPPTAEVALVVPVTGVVTPRPPETPSWALPSEQVLLSPWAQPWKRPPISGLLASERTHWSPWTVPLSCWQQMESRGSTVLHETVLAMLLFW